MKVVLQRAKEAKCTIGNEVVGEIKKGLVLLVGFTHEDTVKDLEWMVHKVIHLRIFEDEEGKMNRSIVDTGGSILSISQFTLYGDVRKGRRPNFMQAAKPEQAYALYDQFNDMLRAEGIQVETGQFGSMMDISLTNHGPVTLILDSHTDA